MSSNTVATGTGSDQYQRLSSITVGEAMHPGIVSCPQSASAAEIARIMAAGKVHCVVVIGLSADRSGEPYVWGIVSDLDLLTCAIELDAPGPAGELASQPVIAVPPDMTSLAAARAMVENATSHVVVVDGPHRTPVGVLSTLDLAALIARPQDHRSV